MTTAYDLALRALRPHLRTRRTDFEEAGGGLSDATTAIANADGTLDIIPLDILSDPVNLKKMWKIASFPIAILFREEMDDWYGLFPADIILSSWNLVAMPGRDHDVRRAKALAERAIQVDFDNPNAIVNIATLVEGRIIPFVAFSSAPPPRTALSVEPAPADTATLSD